MPKIRAYNRTDYRGPEFGVEPAEVHAGTKERLYRAALYGVTLDGSIKLGDARKPYGEAFEDAWKWSHLYGRRWRRDDKNEKGGFTEMGEPIYTWSGSDHGARTAFIMPTLN